MNSLPTRFVALSLALWSLAAVPVSAQKAPELGYVFPPSLMRGKTTDVQLGGYDFTSDMQFFVYDPHAKLTVNGKPGRFLVPEPPYWFGEKGRSNAFPIPREIPASVTVDKNHPPGLVHWQVANANGSSATAVFYVSDTPEIVESRFRNEPQFLKSLPVGISGRISRIAEIDRYAFLAAKDGPITVELLARTLGANFNGVIEVRDNEGKVAADVADTEGIDAALTFAAKAGQRYTVHLHDVDFRGNQAFVYRLAITPGPRVIATVPAKGERGVTCEVKFIGVGIATGQAKLESTTKKLTFPKGDNTALLRYQLETPYGQTPAFNIPLSNLKETARSEQDKNPLKLTIPAAITGTLGESPAEFIWTASKDQSFQIEALSRAIGGQLDLAIEIKDSTGKVLASNDDTGNSSDPLLTFKAPADGDFTCIVSDLSGRSGGIDSIYRLSITNPVPGYSLTSTQQLNIKVGSKFNMQLTVQRTGGHKAAIPIRLEGLPNGITAPTADKLIVPEGQSKLIIAMESAGKSAVGASPIRVVGQVAGEPEVVANAPAQGNLCPLDPISNQTDQILLATTLAPAFKVELVDKNRQRAVHRGTTYPAPFVIKRDEGFDGEIVLQMLARQGRHRQGIDAPILPVPKGATEILYPCYMPEWLETDRTTRMVVLGVGLQKDPLGNVREVTQQADARITMILEGALLQVSHEAKELTVIAGEEFEIPVVVSRSAKLPVPVKLELITPDEIKEHVRLDSNPIDLSPTESKARLKVKTTDDEVVAGRWPLTVRATALQDGRWLVVSQTELSVQFNPGSTAAPNE